jgi:hypothetical protein
MDDNKYKKIGNIIMDGIVILGMVFFTLYKPNPKHRKTI